MSNRPSRITLVVALLVTLTATACSRDLAPGKPTYSQVSDDTVRLEVQVSAADAAYVKNEEIYLTITSHECGSDANRYPTEAYVGDSKISDFDFPVSTEQLTLHADIPSEVFRRYERPCLALEGGGYLGNKVSSASTPIEPKAP